jgi:hypothetical protein
VDGVREAIVVAGGHMASGALYLALRVPMAIEMPDRANMSTSFGMSRIVGISFEETPKCRKGARRACPRSRPTVGYDEAGHRSSR